MNTMMKRDVIDFLFDILDLFNLFIEVMRNLGNFFNRN
jgi:hypothetical protein